MRMSLAPGATALGLVLAGPLPAAAQMYPGQDVTVNPGAVGSPGSLIYPGGLLPPGAKSRDLPPVYLHPPTKHHEHQAAKPHRTEAAAKPPEPVDQAASEMPQPDESAPVEQSAPAKKAKPAPVKEAEIAPPKPAPVETSPAPDETAPAQTPSAIPFSLSDSTPSAPPPAKPAPVREKPQTPQRTASIEQPPEKTRDTMPKVPVDKGLSKQAAILFDTGSADLSKSSTARLNDLAFSLKTALANGADHVELDAYAGPPGDKSSNSRRLSLRRALAVREALIVDGVPPVRIDVRALGGVTDNGATDRVDIFVKA
jgi:outer membrane protein OmpA-like peptidoglycan-associated protein